VPALVRFGKLVGKFYDVVVEMAQRFVFGVRPCIQMYAMRHVSR
jgi:hypothetical protein